MPRADDSRLFRFFFLKTVFGTLGLLLLIVGGLLACASIVKESLPDLEIPQALVTTEWEGAAPELVEKEVTDRIEKKIKSLKGLKRTRSGSMDSSSIVSVEFVADASMEESMQLLRTKVAEAESDFPEAVKTPKIEPVAVSDIPIITFVLFGDLDDALLDDVARRLQRRLEKVRGIKKAEISGSRKEIVTVQLLPSRLAALGISPAAVKDRLVEANRDMPWGRFENEDFVATFSLQGRFREVETLQDLPVARLGHGRVVRLGELARVRRDLDAEVTRTSVSFGGERFRKCVALAVYKNPGRDTLRLIARAKAAVAQAEREPDWPHGLRVRSVCDESVQIWEQLRGVFDNGWEAMVAVFVVLLFLLNWREALLAGLAIPVTFLGALAILYAIGYTLNEIVIIGMVLALGLLVDDFILMMEGMHDALSRGLGVRDAQRWTVRTYAVPSLSGSVTTILAFLPMMVIGGLDGKFIRLIPVTAAVCLLLSYLVSILVLVPLSPVVLARPGGRKARKGLGDRATERVAAGLSRWVGRWAVTSRPVAAAWCLAAAGLFIVGYLGFSRLPSRLYPKEDRRKLGVTVELAPDASLDRAQQVADRVGAVVRVAPHFETVIQYVGMKSPFAVTSIGESLTQTQAPYLVGFSCLFTPKEQRDLPGHALADRLRPALVDALRQFPGTVLLMTPEIGGSSSEDPIQIEITGNDMARLRELSREVQAELARIPGATDVRDNLGPTRTDVSLEPRREALDFYQVRESDLAAQVRLAMAHDKVGTFKMPGIQDDLDIRLGTAWPSRGGELGGPKDWDELALISVYNPDGRRISAASLLRYTVDEAPLAITHQDGLRAVTVMARTAGRTANEVLADLTPALEAMAAEWPEGTTFRFGGEAAASEETFGSATRAFVVALVLIFSVLALVFDSFHQPFIILFSVPFALIGTFAGFFLAGIPFSFPAMVGVIALAGIAVNNAIILIETMNQHRAEGLGTREAAARGAGDRLRPIVSTTVTTTVGLLPLALSNPLWMPLCSAVIYGLLASMVVCLVVIPCLYVLLTPPAAAARQAGS